MRNTTSFLLCTQQPLKLGAVVTHVRIHSRTMASAIVAKRHLHQKRNRKVTLSKVAKKLGREVESEKKLVTSSLSVGEAKEWLDLGTPRLVCRALSEMGFHSPTDIQREAIPVVIRGKKDIVGAAETVSTCLCMLELTP